MKNVPKNVYAMYHYFWTDLLSEAKAGLNRVPSSVVLSSYLALHQFSLHTGRKHVAIKKIDIIFIETGRKSSPAEMGFCLSPMIAFLSNFTIVLLFLLSCSYFTSTGWRILFLLPSVMPNVVSLPVYCFHQCILFQPLITYKKQ